MARAFEALGDRGGSVRLKLHPPELGSLRLHVTLRDGLLTARVEAETTTARSILLDNLPALRERLAAQDVKIDRFDVDLSDRSFGGSPQRPDREGHSQQGAGGGQPSADGEPDGETSPGGLHSPSGGWGPPGRFDVLI